MRGEPMAALAITTVSIYPFEDTTYYLYCDRCGSFRVGTFMSARTRVGLLLAFLSSAMLWNHIGKGFAAGVDSTLWWWAMFLFPVALGLYWAFVHHGHKCSTCGNTRISNEDVLQYGSQGARPYDVAHERLHRHDTLHDKWYEELAGMLLAVVFAFVIPAVMMVAMLAALVAGADRDPNLVAKRSLTR
jgi:hypothetical protein